MSKPDFYVVFFPEKDEFLVSFSSEENKTVACFCKHVSGAKKYRKIPMGVANVMSNIRESHVLPVFDSGEQWQVEMRPVYVAQNQNTNCLHIHAGS